MSPLQINARSVIVERLIRLVREYYQTFGEPVPLRVLSSRFNKALSRVGGFRPTIDSLLEDGTLQVALQKTGAKYVYPSDADAQVEKGYRIVKG